MKYRHLGKAGIQVSELSFGSWVTFHTQAGVKDTMEMMAAAYDAGVNFFDNAEAYANGKSEEIMGEALKRLGWRRGSYLVSTKYFWGIHREVPNAYFTLNRKYLVEAIDKSLERLQLEHVDLVYCHRPDPETPIEETVWAMSDIVASGRALYWGTSEWSADEIRAREEVRRKVVDAVLDLDEPYRTVVLLRYYEDLPPREIAKRTGVGDETVRGRIKRAIAELRRDCPSLRVLGSYPARTTADGAVDRM